MTDNKQLEIRLKSMHLPQLHGVEFILAGIAGCGAGLFTNPLEVVKTRMQLQGELLKRGKYTIHYRNVLHAFYAIAKNDGLLATQKGLVPALWYQFFMNGARLGSYQIFKTLGLMTDADGQLSYPRSILFGAASGCIGACVGSPFYMDTIDCAADFTQLGISDILMAASRRLKPVAWMEKGQQLGSLAKILMQNQIKTQLQSAAEQSIAVGHQHHHANMMRGLKDIYSQFGVTGLWRGVTSAIARVSVGSAVQLSTFSNTKQYIEHYQVFTRGGWQNAFAASMISGVAVTAAMTPFDVVATRMYNQGTTQAGRGLLYSSLHDCFAKIVREEGVWGFYKGWGPSYVRLGPHTTLSLVIWNQLNELYCGTVVNPGS